MRVIAIRTLREFWQRPGCSDAEQPLRAWRSEAEQALWKGPNDIKKQYLSASILGNNRVVFNIKGNKYRLIVAIRYDLSIVFIRFVGTHKENDKVDGKTL